LREVISKGVEVVTEEKGARKRCRGGNRYVAIGWGLLKLGSKRSGGRGR